MVSVLSECACPGSSGVRAWGAGAAPPSPAAEQSPGRGGTITWLSCLLEAQKKSLFLRYSRMRKSTEQGQKWETSVACFLNDIDSLGKLHLQINSSVARANLMSRLRAKAQIRHLSGSNANRQFPTREQSPADVGTRRRRAREYPGRKTPRVRNPALCLNVLTLSSRSIAFSRCFLISVLKYFSCK